MIYRMQNKIIVLLVILVSGCTSQALTEIQIGRYVYIFNYNIYDSIKISVNNRDGVHDLIWNSDEIHITFDGGTADDPYFSIVGFNIVSKLNIYFSDLGKQKTFVPEESDNATFEYTTIYLKGPNTGAKTTSIELVDNMIIVQGMTYEELEKAGDKLVIIVLDIDKRL